MTRRESPIRYNVRVSLLFKRQYDNLFQFADFFSVKLKIMTSDLSAVAKQHLHFYGDRG